MEHPSHPSNENAIALVGEYAFWMQLPVGGHYSKLIGPTGHRQMRGLHFSVIRTTGAPCCMPFGVKRGIRANQPDSAMPSDWSDASWSMSHIGAEPEDDAQATGHRICRY